MGPDHSGYFKNVSTCSRGEDEEACVGEFSLGGIVYPTRDVGAQQKPCSTRWKDTVPNRSWSSVWD